ncbi:MAG: hypothetical protein ACQEQM_02570 [Thermoplasmatota archaeon]
MKCLTKLVMVYRMGFVGRIMNRNYVFDEKKEKAIPDLVTALINEEYEVENVTLRSGRKEINLKKRRNSISVQFNDYSREGNPRKTFEHTMDILESK